MSFRIIFVCAAGGAHCSPSKMFQLIHLKSIHLLAALKNGRHDTPWQ